jgi:hypothetical protein
VYCVGSLPSLLPIPILAARLTPAANGTMDPITAVSLASSIITFVEFSLKLVDDTREIYLSATGKTAQNATAELVITELKLWSARLAAPAQPWAPTNEETAIYNLAGECRAICDEMLVLLDKSRPQRLDSKASATVAVIKDVWHKSNREKCKTRLLDCQKQLKVQVAALDRTKIKMSLENLAEAARNSDNRLAALEKAADDIKTLASSLSIDNAVAKQLRKLQMLPDDAVREIAGQRLLSLLEFPDMHGRFEQVGDAHESTFRWILEQEPSADPPVGLSDLSFVDWLTSGSGVFHISGKLGSGKSTLMKFLCKSDRLREWLSHWANGKQLVIVNFFFWRAENKLQKSLDGLVRSLLHDLLTQRPDLIPSTLPLHWRNITSLHLHAPSASHISNKDIQDAFHRLVCDPRLYEKHSFCVFVDGLDEYEETLECYYENMTTLLLQWAAAEPEGVKICVSSRELPVFCKAFSSQPKLRLQDLTRKDIENLICARLSSFWVSDLTEEDAGAEKKIVSKIADKASGVFLWVALVLKTLREGCRNGDRLKTLLNKIDDLPDDIERLYEHILRSMPKAERLSIYRTIAVVMQLVEYDHTGMTLLQYSFLEDFEDNPVFALEAPVNDATEEQREESPRLERANNRLRGQCKGLLEVKSNTELIAFVHRSAYDFFLVEDTKRLYELQLRGFDAVEAISQTYLAELKFCGRLRRSALEDIRALLNLRKLDNSKEIGQL